MEQGTSVRDAFAAVQRLEGAQAEERVQAAEALLSALDRSSLVSPNEQLSDMQTDALRYLGAEFLLGSALSATTDMDERSAQLLRARKLFVAFLHRCDRLELLSSEEQRALEGVDGEDGGVTRSDERQLRIDAHRREKHAAERIRTLETVVRQMRSAGGASADVEEELRELALLDLTSKCRQSLREIRLIDEEVALLAYRESTQRRTDEPEDPRTEARAEAAGEGLHVTTLSNAGGQLLTREHRIRSVFQPRMSEPSMTLEEFADLEVEAALERERSQAASAGSEARRYRQLEEAGLEDDAGLVDAAAELDRAWDDWKDLHKRGEGNRMNKRF